MKSKSNFPKKTISFDDQITLLQERGLIIDDTVSAKEYLKGISYFRLQGYWWDFQIDKENHRFKEGSTFTNVIKLYTFDRKFRLILFDALERIEIALRTKLVYYPSIESDLWWFENENLFFSKAFHQETLDEVDKELGRTKEIFIKSHYDKYGVEQRPPAYKTLEVVSFGCLSKLYSNLKNEISAKDRIAKELNLPNHNFLRSWLQTFTNVRNIIAHHSRIWNRNIDFAPKLLHKTEFDFINKPENENSIYHGLSCMLFVLNKVSKGHSLKDKVITLLEENESINISDMGFSKNWRKEDIWK